MNFFRDQDNAILFRDLDDPSGNILLCETPVGIGKHDTELFFCGRGAIRLFLLFRFKFLLNIVKNAINFPDIRLVALKDRFKGIDIDFSHDKILA
jgi:hypothetical protein